MSNFIKGLKSGLSTAINYGRKIKPASKLLHVLENPILEVASHFVPYAGAVKTGLRAAQGLGFRKRKPRAKKAKRVLKGKSRGMVMLRLQ
jgi:hypothetical protein